MTLLEQLTEYEEIKTLLKSALKDNLSSGSIVGYTANGTKITYENVSKTNTLIREYNQLISHTEMQIKQLNMLGITA